MKIYGKKLKQAIKNVGYKQIQIADKLNITPDHFSKLIVGKYEMTEETLKKIVKILNTPIIEGRFRKKLLKEYTLNEFINE